MEEMNRKADAVFMTETLFDGQTEQGVELDHVLPDYYRRSSGYLNAVCRRE